MLEAIHHEGSCHQAPVEGKELPCTPNPLCAPISTEEAIALDENAAAMRKGQPKISKNVVQCQTVPRRIKGPLRPIEEEDTLLLQLDVLVEPQASAQTA